MKRLVLTLFAFVLMSGMTFAQNNETMVTQVGADHETDIEQVGKSNGAFVNQNANESPDNATADIKQSGEGNLVRLQQVSFFSESNAEITQLGDGNKVHGQTESEAFLQSNGGGLVDVLMDGDNNTLYSERGEAQKNGNEFLLDITGNDNEVGVAQEFATADVDITGDLNDVSLEQYAGANWSQADYNSATVGITGSSNLVDITQNGIKNSSNVSITGSSNTTRISQASN